MLLRSPISTLFPYTTLFRSAVAGILVALLCISEAALSQATIKLGDRRIVGGEPTDIKEHPWQVALIISQDRKSTRLNSSHTVISYAVFCLKKKDKDTSITTW